MVVDHVRAFCAEAQALGAQAQLDARQLGAEGSVVGLFVRDLSARCEALERAVVAAAADPSITLPAELAAARREADEARESGRQLRDALVAEEARTLELLRRLDGRERVLAELKAHTVREAAHVAAAQAVAPTPARRGAAAASSGGGGSGGSGFGMAPFQLVESVDLELGRVREAAETRVAQLAATHDATLQRQQRHFHRQLEAKERELVQLQLQFRDALRGLQGRQAESLQEAGMDNQSLRRLLTASDQVATIRAEAFFAAKFETAMAALKSEHAELVASLRLDADQVQLLLTESSANVAELGADRARLAVLSAELADRLRRAVDEDLPLRLAEQRAAIESEHRDALAASRLAIDQGAALQRRAEEAEREAALVRERAAAEAQRAAQQVAQLRQEVASREGQMRESGVQRHAAQSQLQSALALEHELQRELVLLRTATGANAAAEFQAMQRRLEGELAARGLVLASETEAAREDARAAREAAAAKSEELALLAARFAQCDADRVAARLQLNRADGHLAEARRAGALVPELQRALAEAQQQLLALQRDPNRRPSSSFVRRESLLRDSRKASVVADPSQQQQQLSRPSGGGGSSQQSGRRESLASTKFLPPQQPQQQQQQQQQSSPLKGGDGEAFAATTSVVIGQEDSIDSPRHADGIAVQTSGVVVAVTAAAAASTAEASAGSAHALPLQRHRSAGPGPAGSAVAEPAPVDERRLNAQLRSDVARAGRDIDSAEQRLLLAMAAAAQRPRYRRRDSFIPEQPLELTPVPHGARETATQNAAFVAELAKRASRLQRVISELEVESVAAQDQLEADDAAQRAAAAAASAAASSDAVRVQAAPSPLLRNERPTAAAAEVEIAVDDASDDDDEDDDEGAAALPLRPRPPQGVIRLPISNAMPLPAHPPHYVAMLTGSIARGDGARRAARDDGNVPAASTRPTSKTARPVTRRRPQSARPALAAHPSLLEQLRVRVAIAAEAEPAAYYCAPRRRSPRPVPGKLQRPRHWATAAAAAAVPAPPRRQPSGDSDAATLRLVSYV